MKLPRSVFPALPEMMARSAMIRIDGAEAEDGEKHVDRAVLLRAGTEDAFRVDRFRDLLQILKVRSSIPRMRSRRSISPQSTVLCFGSGKTSRASKKLFFWRSRGAMGVLGARFGFDSQNRNPTITGDAHDINASRASEVVINRWKIRRGRGCSGIYRDQGCGRH